MVTSALVSKVQAVLGWFFRHLALLAKPFSAPIRRTFLRWRYPAERTKNAIVLRVAGDVTGLQIYAHSSHCAVRVHITVTNHAPFAIAIDRVVGNFKIGCTRRPIQPCTRLEVPAHSDRQLYLEGELLREHVEQIAGELEKNPRIDCGIEAKDIAVHTAIGRTVHIYRDLNAANREFVNFEHVIRAQK